MFARINVIFNTKMKYTASIVTDNAISMLSLPNLDLYYAVVYGASHKWQHA